MSDECDDCRRSDIYIDELQDKIDGLESDLDSAVEVAYRRGAEDWVRLNYPKQYALLRVRFPSPAQ